MNKKILTFKNLTVIVFIYTILVGIFSMIAAPQIKYDSYNMETTELGGVLGGVYEGRNIRQEFFYEGDYIQKINLMSATYNRENVGSTIFTLKNSEDEILWQKEIKASAVKNDSVLKLQINKTIESPDKRYVLEIEGKGNYADNAVTFYTTASPQYQGGISDTDGNTQQMLYMSIYGRINNGADIGYFIFVAGVLLFIVIYWGLTVKKVRNGENNGLSHIINDCIRYGFLIKQLVARDFKTKYKRSILGALWSFLNPILTMAIQYIVFSTIFRSGIENFPVYLLSASILFNFFTEAVGNGLGSITGNVSLITKVSIPRYIYPVSRVLSAGINLLMSTFPLFIVIILTGCKFSTSYILMPLVYIFLLLFCVGLSMLLSTSMVFFRDTQFLWGIASLLWMYATPIFYPESIIPERFSFIFKLNPMYYYLKFFRTILMDNVAPELSLIGMCMFWSIIAVVVGAYVFHKNEKKFTLYI